MLFNLALYFLTYVDKLPWNWTSDFSAALAPVQHADTDDDFLHSTAFKNTLSFLIATLFTSKVIEWSVIVASSTRSRTMVKSF